MVISAYRSAFDQAAAALMIYYILRRVNEDFQQNHITSYINKVCRHDHYTDDGKSHAWYLMRIILSALKPASAARQVRQATLVPSRKAKAEFGAL